MTLWAAEQVQERARSALPIVILSQEPLRIRYHHLFQDFLISPARDGDVDLVDIYRRAVGWASIPGSRLAGNAVIH